MSLQRDYLEGRSESVLNLAPATSTFVVRRLHYLALGGHRSEFAGHGYEDFELCHRMSAYADKYPRPDDYYTDKKSYDSVEYEGFRAMFTMNGYGAWHRGLFTVHLWHPRGVGTAYDKRRSQNRKLLDQMMREFDDDGVQPNPLPDRTIAKRTLVLGVEGDRAILSIRQALPLLGETLYRSEYEFDDEGQLAAFVERKRIDQLFMFNPYGNERRLAAYRWAKENAFPFIVFERGGLTDSWFFDRAGFNADSASYDVEHWEQDLEPAERQRIDEYIGGVLRSEDALEKNAPRVGTRRLRQKLKLSDRRVLFVPFQRPHDTVIRYFAGWTGGVDGFADMVEQVAARLDPKEWVVVAKKHPLEIERPDREGVRFVDDDTHFLDLVALADAVLLMNSGVGLYALMMGKPLMHASPAYYGHDSLCEHVQSTDDVIAFLDAPRAPDADAVARYLHHLRFGVYSFGDVTTETRIEKNGSRTTITTGVAFRELRGLDDSDYTFTYRESPIDWRSPIFDRYRASLARRWKERASSRPPKANGKLFAPRSQASVSRKLRKLRRDPAAFMRDSWLVKRIRSD